MSDTPEGRTHALDRATDPVSDHSPSSSDQLEITPNESLQHLTESSVLHLTKRVSEFTAQVLKEAKSIERAEHVGSGPPEITAAHIDEAWWVSRRRIRRSRHPIVAVVARVIQAFGVAGFGIGAVSLKTSWGPAVFIVATLATLAGFITEAQLARND